MNPGQVQSKARRIIEAIQEDNHIPNWVTYWRWFPFRTPSEDERNAIEQNRLVMELYIVSDVDLQLRIAEKLVLLGEYELQDSLLILNDDFHVGIKYLPIIEVSTTWWQLERDFETYIPGWISFDPDWDRLARRFLDLHLATVGELGDLTLLDVWRALPTCFDRYLDVVCEVSKSQEVKDEKTANSWCIKNNICTIRYQGNTVNLKVRAGFHYIGYMLRESSENKYFSPEELFEVRRGYLPEDVQHGSVDSVLDRDAKRQYEQRIKQLEEQLSIANETGNTDRAGELEGELDTLILEFQKSKKLGGQDRPLTKPPSTKMYHSVQKEVWRAYQVIKKHSLESKEFWLLDLLSHLQHSMDLNRDGWRGYRPETSVQWVVEFD